MGTTGEDVGEYGGRQAARAACEEYGPVAAYACGEAGAYVGKSIGARVEAAFTKGEPCPYGDPADGAQEQMWAIAEKINPGLAADYYAKWRAQVEGEDLNAYQEACLLRGYAADILRQGKGAGASCPPGYIAGPYGKCEKIGDGMTVAGGGKQGTPGQGPPPPPAPVTKAPVFISKAALTAFARKQAAPASKAKRAAVGGTVGALAGAGLGAATLLVPALAGKIGTAGRVGLGVGLGLLLGASIGAITSGENEP